MTSHSHDHPWRAILVYKGNRLLLLFTIDCEIRHFMLINISFVVQMIFAYAVEEHLAVVAEAKLCLDLQVPYHLNDLLARTVVYTESQYVISEYISIAEAHESKKVAVGADTREGDACRVSQLDVVGEDAVVGLTDEEVRVVLTQRILHLSQVHLVVR